MKRKIKRNALNRGTAVHLGGAKVRFIWACGCKHEETLLVGGKPLAGPAAAQLVRHWRQNGVVLEQCQKHPDWYSKVTQVPRLNKENPNEHPKPT